MVDFLRQVPHVESIDAFGDHDGIDAKRADFLLWNRQAVAEIKSLEDDPSHKIEPIIEPERGRDEFPVFYGGMQLDRVLTYLPDGDRIKLRILQRLVRPVEGAFRSADKQIASSKQTFGIEQADGILILLNESVAILSPEVLTWTVARLLEARDSDSGEARFEHINCVWLISESHQLLAAGMKALPSALMRSKQRPLRDDTWNELLALQPAWATFNGVLMVSSLGMDITDAKPREVRDSAGAKAALTRHEVWRLQYRANRYLATMGDEEFAEYGATIVRALMPVFVVGPNGERLMPSIPTEGPLGDAVQQGMEHWTHVLEEAGLRGFDMRKMGERLCVHRDDQR